MTTINNTDVNLYRETRDGWCDGDMTPEQAISNLRQLGFTSPVDVLYMWAQDYLAPLVSWGATYQEWLNAHSELDRTRIWVSFSPLRLYLRTHGE